MEEVVQVNFVKLTALDQNLQVEIRTMRHRYPQPRVVMCDVTWCSCRSIAKVSHSVVSFT